jgi:hypothetical protein
MEPWTPQAPSSIDSSAFEDAVELVPILPLVLCLIFLSSSAALRQWPALRVALLVLSIGALRLALRRTVRFDRRQIRARGVTHAWADLLSVRSYRHHERRVLVLTFRDGVVDTSSGMWRFDRLAGFIGARLHETAPPP